MTHHISLFFFFFFNDTATTEIYTLSLHDALPILKPSVNSLLLGSNQFIANTGKPYLVPSRLLSLPLGPSIRGKCADRKSTRLNSSHANISYAVFCLKKKKKIILTLIL